MHLLFDKFKSHQTRASTRETYHKAWRVFNNFLLRLDQSQTHVSWEDRVVLFGSHLVNQGMQSSTIKSYFCAIKHILRTDGYEWDDNKAMLSSIMKSCKLLNDKVLIRLPIRRRLLDLLLFEIQRIFPDQPYLEKLYLAMLSISYYGMFCIGEIAKSQHSMKARDVHIASNKNKILVILYSSKTHGRESFPQKIKIEGSCMRVTNSFFCPFKLLRSYLQARGDYATETEEFFIFRDRSPVQPENVRSTLRRALKNLGLRPELYNTHSFRIGKATEMMSANYTLSEIMRAGRWRSTRSLMKYFKP